MHMADALISPAVGATMWAATAATTVYCAKKVREEADASKVPLMGVAGAFIFASQMLNFTIPATGSSGHLGGGLILAILLGPEAAFLVMASVLTVQALFFADGGILALGANIFNLGFFPVFIAYPLIYRVIVGASTSRRRLVTGSLLAAIVGLQLGALGVVLETVLSGVSALPFATFALIMLPIHLGVGVVEGLVTAGVVLFVERVQPELLARNSRRSPLGGLRLRPVLVGLAIAAVISGAGISWFASTNPDGLEWSIQQVTGSSQLRSTEVSVHSAAASLQKKTALLPGYGFKQPRSAGETDVAPEWPSPDAGTSTAGVVGAGLVLALAGVVGFILNRRRRT
ncbi:MAG: cobalamin biosynthesis protein CbiM [Actinobacteria bacterium HGW-Actinobacteria-7]|nr:MAG: cobalamin biosynthesis protein CbiM [Actinobacteria bacterium HGW-Actinobacteria-7]